MREAEAGRRFDRKNRKGFVDTALKILISVVIGALFAEFYTLFKYHPARTGTEGHKFV